ncbi:hypothetical protein F0L74_09770 [Chitinophaga agrisoli]|uniref:Uncharacterized protein n=1 Tax=Chitinophaga agrisoli TaxID=2607653 RepID=A0A5B2VX81_9BACT|nr:hypothetical protein [Chitinophaga agrisoli]KAA2242806.1 hypothetical protein F0L74_09770 [Chitinophaga agrisoli]
MDALRKYLKGRPEIEHVYLNTKGEWVFSPNDLHPIRKTRDEVMSGYEAPEEGANEAIESLRVENTSLADQVLSLQIEKEALQSEIDALKAAAQPEQGENGSPAPPAEPTEPDSKKDKKQK